MPTRYATSRILAKTEQFCGRTLASGQQFTEDGMFGNQNAMFKPTAELWRTTADRLNLVFKRGDASPSGDCGARRHQ
jgi:hypothetical protein